MMRNRISMKEAIFYKLYQHYKSEKAQQFIPVFEFMGEIWCAEAHRWGFVSFEVSARLSEMFSDNPGLMERKTIIGKSGARYFGYRFAANVTPELIKDVKLFEFYKLIKR